MPEFVNPFSGKIPDRPLTQGELVRAIRLDLAAEHEAVHTYMSHAEATDNPQFPHFLEYLGRFIIPRQGIRVAAHRPEGRRAYLETFQGEHREICAAIAARDEAAARAAMRRHLGNSQERYRRLAADAVVSPPR